MKKFPLFIFAFVFFINTYAQEKRTFANYHIQKVQEVNLSDYEIFKPYLLDADKLDRIVFFDYVRYKLVVYDLKEKKFRMLGDRGRGPKEFGQVFDLKIDDNGIVYIIDTGNNKVLNWHANGDYINEMSIGSRFIRPARLALCNNSSLMYILSSQYSKDGILHQYDMQGNLKKSFHKIEGNKERSPYYTDGALACGKSENLFYAKLYVNEIIKFNRQGNQIYTIPVFGSEMKKDIVSRKRGMYTLNPSAERYTGDIFILNDKLYASYLGLPRNFIFRYIDVYLSGSQEYLHSIELPYLFREFVITQDKIITLRDGEQGEVYLTVFEYKYEAAKTE